MLNLPHTRQLLSSAVFTPRLLFVGGEQGVWLDPSDLSTMFQDSAATTPVTGVEQPVGLIRDKSGRQNDATQSTAGSRPVLSARVNLLTKTETLNDAAWSARGFSTPVSGQADPFGGTTAWSITENNTDNNPAFLYDTSFNDTVSRTYNVWLRASSNISISISTQGSVSPGNLNVTTTWQKFSVTQAVASIFKGPHIGGFSTISRNSAITIYICQPDFRAANDGVGLPPYQRVNTSTDYDTVGFPYYLRFDGVDDSLATAAIDFTGTDKMSVFAGVRKLSDAGQSAVAELSTTIASNNGAFLLSAPDSAAGNYNFASKGTTQVDNIVTTYAAPITNVVTGLADIGAPSNIIRINGAQASSSTSSQGTGNFGNYALNIGSRNAASLRLNGRLYFLIVRGAASSAQQIANAEAWVNAKTRAY